MTTSAVEANGEHPHTQVPSPFDVQFAIREGLTTEDIGPYMWRSHIELQLPSEATPNTTLLGGVEAALDQRFPFACIRRGRLLVMFSVEDDSPASYELQDEVGTYLANLLIGSYVTWSGINDMRERFDEQGIPRCVETTQQPSLRIVPRD